VKGVEACGQPVYVGFVARRMLPFYNGKVAQAGVKKSSDPLMLT
jgi:hypothetical protein